MIDISFTHEPQETVFIGKMSVNASSRLTPRYGLRPEMAALVPSGISPLPGEGEKRRFPASCGSGRAAKSPLIPIRIGTRRPDGEVAGSAG